MLQQHFKLIFQQPFISQQLLTSKRSLKAAFLLVLFSCTTFIVSGCAIEKVVAKPMDATQVSAKIFAKSANSDDFKNYLVKHGYLINHNYPQKELPFKTWGLNELTLCALFHHPNLSVAKAQMALAEAELQTAANRLNPTVNANIANSSRANEAVKPWSFGLNVEIPIETTNKRAIKIEQAQFNLQAAQLDIAEAAWQLRHQLALDLHAYQQNNFDIALLQNEQNLQIDLLNRLKKRVDVGLQGNTEWQESLIVQQKSVLALQNKQAKQHELLATLAADVGLTQFEFNKITVIPFNLTQMLDQQNAAIDALNTHNLWQQKALLNRIAIRKSLAKYAAAEANIQLEVAKQTPDFSISPGFMFDYGDNIWSLGISSLLNLLQKHPTLINEATKLREIEGAQFELLQHQVISELTISQAQYKANQTRLLDAKNQLTITKSYQQTLQKQLAAGLIDKIALLNANINEQLVLQQIQSAQFDLLKSAIMLENIMQYPLYSTIKLPTS